MASSSTSFSEKRFTYDVFLSFRGEDTRKNFVDHLYFALRHKNIRVYRDDERIKKGKRITDELIKSIEESQFYIIVFSKNYASSSWCLDELVKIIECQRLTAHTAYPVFYDVEPFEVRKQIGLVGNAFAKHKKEEEVVKWREALTEAADLAGWELKKTVDGYEAKFIEKVVEEISIDLSCINSTFDREIISKETRAKGVSKIWNKGIEDCLKRNIGKAISNQITSKSFVDHVVKEVTKASLVGLKLLQNQVRSEVLHNQRVNIISTDNAKNVVKRMFGRKLHYKNMSNTFSL